MIRYGLGGGLIINGQKVINSSELNPAATYVAMDMIWGINEL